MMTLCTGLEGGGRWGFFQQRAQRKKENKTQLATLKN